VSPKKSQGGKRHAAPKRGATRKLPSTPAQRISTNSPPSGWIAKTRSGARAARGFHFQDTVGAWLSVQLLSGRIDAQSITPEGKDDLVLAGSTGEHLVQVKSKQEHLAPFSATDVARLLLDGFGRAQSLEATRVTVCLERIDEGLPRPRMESTLDALPPSDPVRSEVERLLAASGASAEEVEAAYRICGFFELPWPQAEREAVALVVELKDLHVPQVAEPIFNALRQAIASTSDSNAPSYLDELSRLTRSDFEGIVTEILQATDPSHLSEALGSGLCSVVRFQPTETNENYYEGVSTQPRHVAAGLVFQPEGMLDALYERLSATETLVLTGPSGVGKSARAWALAKHVPSVSWFRIDRLDRGDAAVISRFASAMRPSERAPVGFILDQLVASSAPEFEALRRRLADVQHTFLMATVRNEDLPTVLSAHELDLTPVELDEGTAEAIFASLEERGLVAHSTWREAFDQSDGLTLEYTHMLTRGRRLRDVIDAQVQERLLDAERSNEISILALVCQADAWGVTVPALALQEQIRIDDAAMRRATARLAREHLIADPVEGRVRGLHPLRSKAIASAVHRNPPPTEEMTRQSLLAIVDDIDVGAITLGSLLDGHESSRVVADLVPSLWGASAQRVASALRGLRIADFGRVAETWCQAILQAEVPPALVDITASLHMAGSDVDGLPFHPSIPRAWDKLRDLAEDMPTHRRVIQELGLRDSFDAVAEMDDLEALTNLLAALGPLVTAEGDPAPVVVSQAQDLLQASALEDLAECIATARWVSPALADRLVLMAGGEVRILQRILDSDRFVAEAEVRAELGEAVAMARLLHISDTLQPDPSRRVRDLSGLMLRLLPNCERADVVATLVGGHAMELNGYRPWESGLLRRYAISEAEVAWNRTRGLVLQQAVRDRLKPPPRSRIVPPLLVAAEDFLARLTTEWSISRGREEKIEALNVQRLTLAKEIDQLLPPTGHPTTGRDGLAIAALAQREGVPDVASSDDTHTLLSGLVYNLPERLQQPDQWGSLAAFCHDTLTKALLAAAGEARAWTATDLNPVIDRIGQSLRDLHAVLAELAWGTMTSSDVTRWARSGPYATALARTAAAARSSADRSAAESAATLTAEGQARGLELRVSSRAIVAPDATNWPPKEFAIGVSLDAVDQWASSLGQVEQIVDQVLPTGHAPTLIYPLIEGRAVATLAHVRITSSFSGAHSFVTWTEQFADAAPTVITDAAVKAHQALQEVSSLAALDSVRPEVDYQPDVDAATTRFRESVEVLHERADNEGVVAEILEALSEAAGRVEAESGHAPQIHPGTLAEQVVRGSLRNGDPPEWTTMNALVAVAVLCDVNPRLARELLDKSVSD